MRHGETIENKNRIVQGQRDGTLSELGEKQVLKLAQKLKNEKFSAIYTSDLGRCVKTTDAVTTYHKNTPIIKSRDLREFKFGILEGLPLASKKHRFSRLGIKLPLKLFGIESPRSVRLRIKKFLNSAYTKHHNERILIISHGGPIRMMRSIFENKSFGSLLWVEVDNCSIWRQEMNEKLT